MNPYRRTWKFTFRNREVHSPAGRLGVGMFLAIVGVPMLLFGMLLLAILIPLSLPLHFLVRALGGKGFWNPATGQYAVPPWAGLLIIVVLALVVVALA
jgi:hypothetical protein